VLTLARTAKSHSKLGRIAAGNWLVLDEERAVKQVFIAQACWR
jgi:hypothetical protein